MNSRTRYPDDCTGCGVFVPAGSPLINSKPYCTKCAQDMERRRVRAVMPNKFPGKCRYCQIPLKAQEGVLGSDPLTGKLVPYCRDTEACIERVHPSKPVSTKSKEAEDWRAKAQRVVERHREFATSNEESQALDALADTIEGMSEQDVLRQLANLDRAALLDLKKSHPNLGRAAEEVFRRAPKDGKWHTWLNGTSSTHP